MPPCTAAPQRSDRDRGGVIVVEPVHALAQAHLLPLARDLVGDAVLVGERWRERTHLVLARLAHDHRGALPADFLVAGEGETRFAEILVETGRKDVSVLDRHHAAL